MGLSWSSHRVKGLYFMATSRASWLRNQTSSVISRFWRRGGGTNPNHGSRRQELHAALGRTSGTKWVTQQWISNLWNSMRSILYCIGGYHFLTYCGTDCLAYLRLDPFLRIAREVFLQEFCLMFTVPVDIHSKTAFAKLAMRDWQYSTAGWLNYRGDKWLCTWVGSTII